MFLFPSYFISFSYFHSTPFKIALEKICYIHVKQQHSWKASVMSLHQRYAEQPSNQPGKGGPIKTGVVFLRIQLKEVTCLSWSVCSRKWVSHFKIKEPTVWAMNKLLLLLNAFLKSWISYHFLWIKIPDEWRGDREEMELMVNWWCWLMALFVNC